MSSPEPQGLCPNSRPRTWRPSALKMTRRFPNKKTDLEKAKGKAKAAAARVKILEASLKSTRDEAEEVRKALRLKCENDNDLIAAIKLEIRKAGRDLEKAILDSQFSQNSKENWTDQANLQEELTMVGLSAAKRESDPQNGGGGAAGPGGPDVPVLFPQVPKQPPQFPPQPA